jgi:hypothetical protein
VVFAEDEVALYWVEIGKVVDVCKKRDKNVGPFGWEMHRRCTAGMQL